MPAPTPVNVFICHAHEAEELARELETHLASLRKEGLVRSWTARAVGGGEAFRGEVEQRIAEAGVILLLVSADFLASDYLYDVELKRALERYDARDAIVRAVLLRPCDWQGTPLARVLRLPESGVPVTRHPDADEAFTKIVQELRKLIEQKTAEEGRPIVGRISNYPRVAHLPVAPGR